MTAQNLPVVTVVDGEVTTLSTDVAAFFQKDHSKVIRAIENIISHTPQDRLANFGETVVTRENPSGGAPIKSKAYRLTRDGFTFLAMGFTGERAQAFKWAYIDAFNRMEKQLHPSVECPIATLTPAQQLQLREAVAKRAKAVSAHYQTIYRALYQRFQVPRYTEILAKDFDKAIEFIQTVDLSVPEKIPETVPEREKAPEKKPQVIASKEFCEHIRTFVYLWKYYYRADLDKLIEVLRAMDSPHAAGIYDLVHDMSLASIEFDLANVGFPVKDLACYQHWALTHEADAR